MARIQYSHITTNGKTPVVPTSANHTILLSPVHVYLFFSNELNDTDTFISINDQDFIRVPANGFLEIGEQSIIKFTISDNDLSKRYNYVARY